MANDTRLFTEEEFEELIKETLNDNFGDGNTYFKVTKEDDTNRLFRITREDDINVCFKPAPEAMLKFFNEKAHDLEKELFSKIKNDFHGNTERFFPIRVDKNAMTDKEELTENLKERFGLIIELESNREKLYLYEDVKELCNKKNNQVISKIIPPKDKVQDLGR